MFAILKRDYKTANFSSSASWRASYLLRSSSFLAQKQSEHHIAALTEELREQRKIAGLGTTVTDPGSGFDAGSRLTNAFEFLEMLLLELPNETALIAHGVNRQFKSVIAKSRPLQRKLFFETDPLS
ncbi:hypothetical protein LTR74_016012 [Friedmanniomyces endolithicus]|nr:hypothetical protein LTR74_016012 [Friedmanniomyces endolithicus]